MLELNINDNSVYRLNDVIKIPSTYTFSIWYKTNKNTKITFNVLGDKNQISSGTSWKKFVKTVEVDTITEANDSIDIEIENGSIGYFYEAYLSEGVSDTSWSPAPEDIDDNIESVKSEFTQTAEEIKMSVKNIKGDVSNLNIQVGKIEQSVADNKGNISSLTTTVSGINTTVKKQGESISNINQKADKISQQVTSVKNELSSKIELTAGEITQKVDDVRADLSSEIKQTSDRISQTVTDMNNNLSTRIDQTAKDIELNASKTEEIGTKLDNLEIGGRNILKNSKNGIVCTGTNYSSTTTPGATITTKATGIGNAYRFIEGFYTTPVTELSKRVGTEFAFSLDVKITGSFTNLRTKVDFRDTSHNSSIFSNFIGINGLEVGKWTRVSGVASVKEVANVTATRSLFLFDWSNSTVGSTIEYRNLQLEEGNKSTAWTPAPEDIENELTNNYYNKTQMESKLQIQSDNITANVKKEVTTIKNDLDQNYYDKSETDSKFQIQSDSITSTVKKEVTTQIGNIEIGGRNLLLDTRDFGSKSVWVGNRPDPVKDTDGMSYVGVVNTWSKYLKQRIDLLEDIYTLSFYAKASSETTLEVRNDNAPIKIFHTVNVNSVDWKRYLVSVEVDYEHNTEVTFFTRAAETIYIKGIKLEKGNKSTAWTPAPEDIENELTNNYYNKTQMESKLQIQSDNITANVKKEVTTIKNDLDQNYYDKSETDSKFQIQSDSITSTVKKEVTTQIGNIEIGGRNLLLDTRDFGSKSVWVGNRPDPVKDTDGMSYVGVVNTWSKYLKQRIDLLEDIYTLSFYAKASSETTLEVRNDNAPIKIFHTVNVNSVDWKRYLVSVEVDYEHNTEVTFFTRAAETIYIKGIKLEKGNKATDWSPAPEDMATADSLADVNSSLTDATNDLQSNINSTNKNLQDIQNSQNEVYEIVSQNKSQISSLTQRAEGFTMDFKTVNETVKQINNQFVTERDERYKYIKFIDGEIWLGKEVPIGEDDFKLVIKNDRISFLQNKTEVAYMSNNKLYVTDIHVTSSLQLGRFVLSSRANGNVGLRWIGN